MMNRSIISVAFFAFVAAGVFLGGGAVADPALKGHWSFDEGSGLVAANAAGPAGAKVPAALKWVNGKTGKAVSFNGKDFVVVKHIEEFNSPQYTFAAWTKFKNTGDHHYIVWKAGPEFPEAENARRFDLWTSIDGIVNGIVHDKAGLDNLHFMGQANIADDKWHHVALTYDSRIVKLYVDGKKETDITPQGPLAKNKHDLWIGGRPEGVVATGAIDDVRFYTRALSAKEVAALAGMK